MPPIPKNTTPKEVWRRVTESLRKSETETGVIGTIHEADLRMMHTDTEAFHLDDLKNILDRILKLPGGLELLEKFKKDATAKKSKEAKATNVTNPTVVTDWVGKVARKDTVKRAKAGEFRPANTTGTTAGNGTAGADPESPPGTEPETKRPKLDGRKKKVHVSDDDDDGAGKDEDEEHESDTDLPIVSGYKDEEIARRYGHMRSSPLPEPKLPKDTRVILQDEAVIGTFKTDATPKRLIVGSFNKGNGAFCITPISYTPGGDVVYTTSVTHNRAWMAVAPNMNSTSFVTVGTAQGFELIVQARHPDTKQPMTFTEAKDYVWKTGRDKAVYCDWGYMSPKDMEDDDTIRERMNQTASWLRETRKDPDLYVKPEQLQQSVRSLTIMADSLSQLVFGHFDREKEVMEAKRVELDKALAKVDTSGNSFHTNLEAMNAAIQLANTTLDSGLHIYKSTLVDRGYMPPAYKPNVTFPTAWKIQELPDEYVSASSKGDESFTCIQLRKGYGPAGPNIRRIPDNKTPEKTTETSNETSTGTTETHPDDLGKDAEDHMRSEDDQMFVGEVSNAGT